MKFCTMPGYTPAKRMLAANHTTIAPPSTQIVRANAFAKHASAAMATMIASTVSAGRRALMLA